MTITKALTKTTSCTLRAKKVEGHDQQILRRFAPDRTCPSTFLALKVQLVVLVSAFVMVSTVWSVSCLLFF